ncbi:MAG TPA: prepilin-type N-terminal cleavage/methylation domain-containing protein [Chthonomonadaceae bacterium]|nr:prepilin-type N-terminal cleavage/methylation domain-containing protein [Chthonomonadaceae bacterium]
MSRRRGLTLVEVLMALTLGAVVLVPVLLIFATLSGQWARQISRSKAIQEANLAVDGMAKEIREAISFLPYDAATNTANVFTLPANRDASGNYVPAWQNGTLQYQPGTQVSFYLANARGNAGGPNLWRQYKLPGGNWTADAAWSLLPGSSVPRIGDVQSLSFDATGTPPNVVRLTLTVAVTEGIRTWTYTVRRDVYMAHHN